MPVLRVGPASWHRPGFRLRNSIVINPLCSRAARAAPGPIEGGHGWDLWGPSFQLAPWPRVRGDERRLCPADRRLLGAGLGHVLSSGGNRSLAERRSGDGGKPGLEGGRTVLHAGPMLAHDPLQLRHACSRLRQPGGISDPERRQARRGKQLRVRQGSARSDDRANRASATAMVYRDVSEAFWKIGDRRRAVAVFKEGRAAGGDSWLFMSSAAGVAE